MRILTPLAAAHLLLATTLAPAPLRGQTLDSITPRPLQWTTAGLDSLDVPLQRALLAPPVYWFNASMNRYTVESLEHLWSGAVIVDWHVGSGTGYSANLYFVVFPMVGRPPVVAWSAYSEKYSCNRPDGECSDNLRTCLYRVGSRDLVYVPIHEPSMGVPDSLERRAGVYRLGLRSNLSEPEVTLVHPLDGGLEARCRGELDRAAAAEGR